MYRAMLETQDRFGKKVTAQLPLRVLDPDAKKLAIKIPNLFDAPEVVARAGRRTSRPSGAAATTGPGLRRNRTSRQVLQSYWTDAGPHADRRSSRR